MKDRKNLAVLLIDMQEPYLRSITGKEKLIHRQSEVLKICAKKDIPTAVIEKRNRGETIFELNSLIEKIPRKAIIEKMQGDGFEDTNLYEKLSSWNVDSVFLMGVYADACVYNTAEGAISKNLKISSSEDVISQDSFPYYDEDGWYSKNGIFKKNYWEIPAFKKTLRIFGRQI